LNAELTVHAFSQSVLILLAVIAIKTIISQFIKHEPLRFFQFYCQQLSNKVNKSQNTNKQQNIAVVIAVWLTLAPVLVILWLFAAFIEVNWLWQGLLLYVAIGGFGLGTMNKSIAQALVANQTYVAKQTLKPWVLRDTEQLSAMGLSKACVEMQLLRFLQQMFVVSCLFLTLGPLVALGYRLILEMHYCWNIKKQPYYYFGSHAHILAQILQWLPVRLFSLLLLISAIGKNARLFWRLSSQYFSKLNNNLALSLFALNLSVKLGGVAMYDKYKCRKISFNDQAKQPEVTDIIHANKKIKALAWLCLIFITIIAATFIIVQNS